MAVVRDLVNILAEIPLEVWSKIVENEPEWLHMKGILRKYEFSRFAVLMITAGLNDFQLKGKAEVAYWPKLRELLDKNEVPSSLNEMKHILSEFYKRERFANLKLKRLNRFLSSELAVKLWNAEPKDVASNFLRIWHDLATTMRQNKDAKTIVFAMKCLGIALIMAGESNFRFEQIPIPVDYRVRIFTKRLGVNAETDDEVRRFWNNVLEMLRKDVPINMIHLDSLIWQIGTMSNKEIIEYFKKFGLESVGEKLVEGLK